MRRHRLRFCRRKDAGVGLRYAMSGMQHFAPHPFMLVRLHVIGRGVGRGYVGQDASLRPDPSRALRRGV